jgi:hypothetical protein
MAFGGSNTVSGEYNQAIGYALTNTAPLGAFLTGFGSTTSASYSTTFGIFAGNVRAATMAFASGRFSATGDAQVTLAALRATTANATPTELFLEGSVRLTVASGGIFAGTVSIVGTKTDGSAVAHFLRQFCIKNVSGTTSAVYAAVTLGTDNAAGTSVAVTADDTNDSLKVEVTGIAAENWRWQAVVIANDIKYA